MMERVKNFTTGVKEKMHELKHAFNMTIAMIITIFLFMFAPDKFYFIIFTIFFSITIYYAMQKIANLKHILTVDFKNNRIGLYQMSQKRFNDYEVVDETGKPTTINYRLFGRKSEILIADNIKGRKIIINPICSNVEFVRDYKDVAMKLKEQYNKTINDLILLKAKFRHETMVKAVELLDKLAIVDKINIPFEQEEEKADIEEKIDELIEKVEQNEAR